MSISDWILYWSVHWHINGRRYAFIAFISIALVALALIVALVAIGTLFPSTEPFISGLFDRFMELTGG